MPLGCKWPLCPRPEELNGECAEHAYNPKYRQQRQPITPVK